jgi:hypothetical protein
MKKREKKEDSLRRCPSEVHARRLVAAPVRMPAAQDGRSSPALIPF